MVSGQLDNEEAEAILVVLSSTGLTLPISAPLKVVPASVAPFITETAAAPSNVATAATSPDVAHTIAPALVAPIISLAPVPPSIPMLPASPSFSLALSLRPPPGLLKRVHLRSSLFSHYGTFIYVWPVVVLIM